jgi:uncharacterized protein YqkB
MKKFLSDVLVDCNLTVSGTTSLGAATGVTVASSDNSTNLATTAFVKAQGFVSTNTTYDISVPSGTTKIRLASSGGVNDDITISAAGASTVSRVSDSEIRITSTNSVDYVSNVALNGTVLEFSGVGNGFAENVDLGSINTDTNYYLSSASFNTTNGVLTLGRQGLSDITVDLDNRYLTSESDTLDTVTSRDGVTTNTIGVGTVNVTGSTAGAELLTVDGTNGRLFTVTDDLSDSLFSVNTIAGLPVIEVFADNTIKLGNFANPIEIDSSANIVIPGTITASGYNDSNWNTAFNDRITAAAVSGTSTKTLTLTQGDGSTITTSWTDIEGSGADGYISDVALNGNSLDFNAVGSGFAGSIDLSGITTDLTGYATEQYVLDNSDDYGSWNLKTNNVQRTTVQSGGTLDIVAGSNVSVAYGAGGVVTISSTDTNTDTNNYVTGLSFNTGNGILTATRQGLADLTVDLDGRYLTSFTETLTELSLASNILSYRDETGAVTELDLSLYLDDTNLARLTSGTLDSNTGIATFSRDDSSTFTVDFSALFDDVDNYVDSVAFSTSNGVLTIGRTGSLANLTVDLDGRYDLVGTAAAEAGIVNTRIDEEILPAIGDKLDSSVNPIKSATVSNDTITFTRADNTTFAITTSDANTNYYLDNITKSGNTLTYVMNGKTDVTYTFGSNAFTSYTDHVGLYDAAGTAASEAGIVNTRIDEEVLPLIQTPAILSNGTTPSLNTGISAAEVRTLIGAGTSSTDTNYYLNGVSFNTSNGVLALTVSGATNQSVDLDGRYKVFSEELLPARPEQIAPPDSYPLGLYVTDSESSAPYSWAFDAGIVWGIHPANANNRHLQFISNYDGSELMMRMKNGTADEWRGWNHIATRNWVTSQGYLTSYTETDTLDSVSDRNATTSNVLTVGGINMNTGKWITFYGNSNAHHGIGGADINNNGSDDIRINSYHNVYVNLDSNNNNTSATTEFVIGEHGGTSTLSDIFFRVKADGEVDIPGHIKLSNATIIDSGAGDGVPEGTVIETFSAAENIGAFLDFTIYDDDKGNMRAGTLQLVFNGDQVMFNEVNTMDIGDTTPCTLDAVNNAGTIDVRFTSPDPTFHIKYHVRTL